MKRVAIINFTGFRGNWGCQATSFELMKFIAGCFPKGEALSFTCIPLLPTSKVDVAYEPQLDRVYSAFTDVARQTDAAASSLAFLEQACTRRYGFWADIVKAADLVVFQAEGSMGLGADFARGPRLMLLPFVARHAWGRRVISLNQSFYSQDERVLQNGAETFSTLDFAGFREGASVALARANGVGNAAYVPDLAFMTRGGGTNRVPALAGEPGYFAVSGSALKDPDRYKLILAQAEAIRDATGLKPLIAVSRDVQMKLMAHFRWWPGSFAVVPRAASYTNVAAMLAKCRFLIGGRYHMTIMAAAVGTPNIILRGNSFKNEGLASLLVTGRPVRNFGDADGILADAKAILAHEADERAALAAQVGHIRATIADAQTHLARLIAGEVVGTFKDTLPAYDYKPETLELYRKYGSGKAKKRSRALPGERLGRQEPVAQIVGPLLEGIAGDPAVTLDTLSRMAAGDAATKAYLRGQVRAYPALAPVLTGA